MQGPLVCWQYKYQLWTAKEMICVYCTLHNIQLYVNVYNTGSVEHYWYKLCMQVLYAYSRVLIYNL